MKKIIQTLRAFPEYYLIVLVLLTGYSPPFTFNIVTIIIAIILMVQIIFKNKISGLIIASIFLLINLYMLGALVSELSDFTEFNNKAKQLLFVGLSIWCLNMLFTALMIYKYVKTTNTNKDFRRLDL